MPDNIANFPLRGATDEQLIEAIGRSHADYQAWHYQATCLQQFIEDAHRANVKEVQLDRIRGVWQWAKERGMGFPDPAFEAKAIKEMEAKFLADQETASRYGSKLAGIVMMHSSSELLYWRLARAGLVAKRQEAIEFHSKKNVSVKEVSDLGTDAVIDLVLERWWELLERESLLKKWDSVIAQFGMPSNTKTADFDFTRPMLEAFDEVRHSAVHHDAAALKAFDLRSFATQLTRFNTVLVMHVYEVMKLKPDPIAFFGLSTDGMPDWMKNACK